MLSHCSHTFAVLCLFTVMIVIVAVESTGSSESEPERSDKCKDRYCSISWVRRCHCSGMIIPTVKSLEKYPTNNCLNVNFTKTGNQLLRNETLVKHSLGFVVDHLFRRQFMTKLLSQFTEAGKHSLNEIVMSFAPTTCNPNATEECEVNGCEGKILRAAMQVAANVSNGSAIFILTHSDATDIELEHKFIQLLQDKSLRLCVIASHVTSKIGGVADWGLHRIVRKAKGDLLNVIPAIYNATVIEERGQQGPCKVWANNTFNNAIKYLIANLKDSVQFLGSMPNSETELRCFLHGKCSCTVSMVNYEAGDAVETVLRATDAGHSDEASFASLMAMMAAAYLFNYCA